MTAISTYALWRGDDVWRSWVKPALFAQLAEEPATGSVPGSPHRAPGSTWAFPNVDWAPAGRSMLVLDLEAAEGLELALALVPRGYRPVVAINTCTDQAEVIDMTPVVDVLRAAAQNPGMLPRSSTAPRSPAFVLDARRNRPVRPVAPGAFDNRWMTFPGDFPTSSFLEDQGIRDVTVVQHGPAVADDLALVLAGYQQAGLPLMLRDIDEGATIPLSVQARGRLSSVWQVWRRQADLPRRPDGSFGLRVLHPAHG